MTVKLPYPTPFPAVECAIQYDRKAGFFLADHARRKTPQDREKTPNRLLQLILTCWLIKSRIFVKFPP